ncbi:MAG: hypothetical protein JOZ57_17545 [Abitibacteriaceae bacterium]|nr:hypothetical protein [Abditibacteriaceae bacterium]
MNMDKKNRKAVWVAVVAGVFLSGRAVTPAQAAESGSISNITVSYTQNQLRADVVVDYSFSNTSAPTINFRAIAQCSQQSHSVGGDSTPTIPLSNASTATGSNLSFYTAAYPNKDYTVDAQAQDTDTQTVLDDLTGVWQF